MAANAELQALLQALQSQPPARPDGIAGMYGPPQNMPSYGQPPGFPLANQQALDRWVAAAPEFQAVNWRRPVTTGSDFIP